MGKLDSSNMLRGLGAALSEEYELSLEIIFTFCCGLDKC